MAETRVTSSFAQFDKFLLALHHGKLDNVKESLKQLVVTLESNTVLLTYHSAEIFKAKRVIDNLADMVRHFFG